MVEITADLVLRAYAAGVFPMSEDGDDERVFWVDPKQRGIMPLPEFHLPRRLRRTVKSGQFKITINCCFQQVMAACAASAPTPAPDRISEIPPGPGRAGTWINRPLMDLFCELHDMGFAHSVEVLQDDELVGGLYGVSLGAAFFGESMFSRRRDASKVAMVHLVGRLITAGYQLLDTQFVTDHLRQFGTREISRVTYHRLLSSALGKEADFTLGGRDLDVAHILQSITQTS